jgi:hypothetical protein
VFVGFVGIAHFSCLREIGMDLPPALSTLRYP